MNKRTEEAIRDAAGNYSEAMRQTLVREWRHYFEAQAVPEDRQLGVFSGHVTEANGLWPPAYTRRILE